MKKSKLGAIIRHEYLTILRQPSFWIVTIALPVLLAAFFGLIILGSQSSIARVEQISEDLKNVVIIDDSGYIDRDVISAADLTLAPADTFEAARSDVQNGTIEALIVFPENLAETRQYNIYLSSTDVALFSGASSLASNLLRTSLFLPLGSPEVVALAQNGATSNLTTYRDGQETGGFNDFIAPGLFVVLFYIIFAFSVSYMLTSVSAEKENRSMEMILTYVKPRQLILGKLLAVSLVTLTQIIFFAILAVIAFLIAINSGTSVPLPAGVDPNHISIDPLPILFGIAFLVVGFLMYAGFMTATAAATPSSKEANNFSAIFFIGAFLPIYFIPNVITDPDGPFVQFLTYFPLTSPVIALIRNTVGSMSELESLLVLIVMTGFMIISIWIAVKAFRLGALDYGNTIKLSKLFRK